MDCLGFHFAAATELARIAISLVHVLDRYRAVRRDNTGSLPESYRADGVASASDGMRMASSRELSRLVAQKVLAWAWGSHLEYDSFGRGRPRPSRV
jgi:hypothetical protein